MFKKRVITAILAVITFAANADEVTFQWDPVTDSRVDGYELHWGGASGSYAEQADVDGVATNTVTITLDPGVHYAAVRSHSSTLGMNSIFSNEVTITVEEPPLEAPSNLQVILQTIAGWMDWLADKLRELAGLVQQPTSTS